MGVTNYATINGALVGENGPNGTMYYHTDALGSVTMTSDQNGDVLNEYRYKPFGTVKTKTGTAPDPKFLWVGSLGYRQTGRDYSDAYVRARHFGYLQGAWLTVDPLWPSSKAYIYAESSPTTYSDPTGRDPLVCLDVCEPCYECIGFSNCVFCGLADVCWHDCILDQILNLPIGKTLQCAKSCSQCLLCFFEQEQKHGNNPTMTCQCFGKEAGDQKNGCRGPVNCGSVTVTNLDFDAANTECQSFRQSCEAGAKKGCKIAHIYPKQCKKN